MDNAVDPDCLSYIILERSIDGPNHPLPSSKPAFIINYWIVVATGYVTAPPKTIPLVYNVFGCTLQAKTGRGQLLPDDV